MATLGSEPQPLVPALSAAALHPQHHPQQHQHQHQHQAAAGASGGAGGGFHLPLNRGLERALEEAATSGGLNLSARKLKEFPRTAAPGHDLSDTVQAGERGGEEPAAGVSGRLSVCLSVGRAVPDAGPRELWPRGAATDPPCPEPRTAWARARPGAGGA